MTGAGAGPSGPVIYQYQNVSVVHNVIYPNGTVVPQGSVTTGTNAGGGGGGASAGGAPSTPPFEADAGWSGGVSGGWYFVTGKWTTDSKSSYEGLTLHLHVSENGSIGGFILQKKVCVRVCGTCSFFFTIVLFSKTLFLDSFFILFYFFFLLRIDLCHNS